MLAWKKHGRKTLDLPTLKKITDIYRHLQTIHNTIYTHKHKHYTHTKAVSKPVQNEWVPERGHPTLPVKQQQHKWILPHGLVIFSRNYWKLIF